MARVLFILSLLSLFAGFALGVEALLVLTWTVWLLLAACAFLARAPLGHLTARREMTRWASEDQRILVQIEVENRSPWPVWGVRVRDRFTADKETDKEILFPKRLDGHSKQTEAYQGICSKRRGNYTVGPLKIDCSDPLGLFTFPREIPAQAQITVFPKTFPIIDFPLGGRSSWDTVASRTTLKAGSSLNFFGTREYRQGDNIRFIHWPASARTGKLIIKEFELDLSTEVTLILDLHYFTLKGFGRETTLEYAVRVASSIAEYAIAEGSQVQFLAMGKKAIHVPLGGGQVHLMSLLHELVGLQASGEVPIEEFLIRSVEMIPGGSTAVILFNSMQTDLKKYIDAITILKAKGVRLVAVLIDDNTFLNLWESVGEKSVQAGHIPDLVRLLVTHGLTVYTVGRGEDMASIFQKPYAPI